MAAMGPIGDDPDCQGNGERNWCRENGADHWPAHAVGCYEIADDDGTSDCNFDNEHTNTILFSWLGSPVERGQLERVIVRTETRQDVCSNQPGFEDNDGWEYGTLPLVLDQGNGWMQRFCIDPPWPSGEHGPYQWRALFDGDDLFTGLEVRAGDHKDEGAFEVLDITLTFRGLCADGTPEGQCSSTQPYFCTSGILSARCETCGCPEGLSCYPDGLCRRIGGGSPTFFKIDVEQYIE